MVHSITILHLHSVHSHYFLSTHSDCCILYSTFPHTAFIRCRYIRPILGGIPFLICITIRSTCCYIYHSCCILPLLYHSITFLIPLCCSYSGIPLLSILIWPFFIHFFYHTAITVRFTFYHHVHFIRLWFHWCRYRLHSCCVYILESSFHCCSVDTDGYITTSSTLHCYNYHHHLLFVPSDSYYGAFCSSRLHHSGHFCYTH